MNDVVWCGMVDGQKTRLHVNGATWAKVDGGEAYLTGQDAKRAWEVAFLDLRATSKKVVETQTRDSRDRAIDELAKKIGMET